MPAEAPVCAYCEQPMAGHWMCAVCRCLGHANVQTRWDKAICKDCDKALANRGARRCKTCEQIKPLAKFKRTRTSFLRKCNTCAKRSRPRYDPERTKKRLRAWRARNRERYNAWARQRYATHREQVLERQRRSYQEQRERRLAYAREYHQRNRAVRALASKRQHLARKLAILREIQGVTNGR